MSLLGGLSGFFGGGGGGGNSSTASNQSTSTNNLGNSSTFQGPATIVNGSGNTVTDNGAVHDAIGLAGDTVHAIATFAGHATDSVQQLATAQQQNNTDTLGRIADLAENIKTDNNSSTTKIIGAVALVGFLALAYIVTRGTK